jgi:hypothetical protein
MRRAPVLVAVVLFAAGLAVMVPGWLLDDRDYLAVTPQPPAVEWPTQLGLPAEGRVCMNTVALDERSEEARIGPVEGGAVPLELTIRGERGYFARARTAADYRSGDVVALPVQPPTRSVIATVCLHNGGRDDLLLTAVVDRRRSRSAVFQNGVAVQPGFVIRFAEREPVSILERFPDSVRRMTVLRPAVVFEITLWSLIVLFVAGIPIVALWAFARSVQDDTGRAQDRQAPR